MIHTDKYKPSEYFQGYIDSQKKRIDKFKEVLEGSGEPDRTKLCVYISNFLKDLISAQFSNNEDMASVESSFREYAEYKNVVGFFSYAEYIDFLSLEIIFGIDDCYIADPKEYDDDLSRILLNYIFDENKPLSGKMCFPEYYDIFRDYWSNSIRFSDLMDYVNNKWYNSSSSCYWYNSHIRENDTYTGYWCYIASALIRIKGDYDRINIGDSFIV